MSIFSPTAIPGWFSTTGTKRSQATPITPSKLRRLLTTGVMAGLVISISLTPMGAQAAGQGKPLTPPPALWSTAAHFAAGGQQIAQAGVTDEGGTISPDDSSEEPTPPSVPCPVKGGSTQSRQQGSMTTLLNPVKVLGPWGFDIEGSGTRGCGG